MSEPKHIPDDLKGVLVSTPDTLSGAVRFVGTRVPVQALLDSIEGGRSVEYFLEGYPGVTRDQVMAVLIWQQHQTREALGLEKAS